MEDKYYTPEREEFQIGFCYERNDGGEWFEKVCDGYDIMDIQTMINKTVLGVIAEDSKTEEEYGQKALSTDYYGVSRKFVLNNPQMYTNKIRVKYLDKSDIEDILGKNSFHKSTYDEYLNQEVDCYHSLKLNIMVGHYPEINKISVLTKDPSKNEMFSKVNYDDKQINLMTCKNKSEFKKILKNINVL